jgi:hypothetical protein
LSEEKATEFTWLILLIEHKIVILIKNKLNELKCLNQGLIEETLLNRFLTSIEMIGLLPRQIFIKYLLFLKKIYNTNKVIIFFNFSVLKRAYNYKDIILYYINKI